MTEEVGKVHAAQAASTGSVKPAKSNLKTEARMEIAEGMRVADVKANGSEAQKIAAEAFDEPENLDATPDKWRGDGVYDKKEAKEFNNYRFAYDPAKKEFRAHNQKTGCSVTLKYKNMEQLKKYIHGIRQAEDFKGGQITLDFENKSAKYDGVNGYAQICRSDMSSYTFKNSSIKHRYADFYSGQLTLDNVKDVGTLWDSPTEVLVTNGKEPTIKAANSEFEIKRCNRE